MLGSIRSKMNFSKQEGRNSFVVVGDGRFQILSGPTEY